MLVRASRVLSFLAGHVAAFIPLTLSLERTQQQCSGCKVDPPGSVGLRDIACQALRPFLWLVDAEEPPQLSDPSWGPCTLEGGPGEGPAPQAQSWGPGQPSLKLTAWSFLRSDRPSQALV